MLTDTQLYDRLNKIREANRLLVISLLVLSIAVAVLWWDTRAALVRVRWIERKFDQGKLIAVDQETLEEWRMLNETPQK